MPERSTAEPATRWSFEPVPPPWLPPGELTAARLDPVLHAWASSPPLRALAEASGWDWPGAADTAGLLTSLADLSADWDFRGRARRMERNFIGTEPAEVNGLIVPDDLVVAAATALGLVTAGPPPTAPVTHLVVLSGLVRACINRTRHAADLLGQGLRAGSTVILAGHRELGGDEPALARDEGLGELFDEADAVLAATRQAFSLGDPEWARESGPRPARWDEALRSAWARYHWPDVEVVVAPSGDPAARRTNTADQLRFWAQEAGIGRTDQVLLLTTQIYVPFQQLVGIRLLGLDRGCSVSCCGVDAASSYLPAATFGGKSYLQEIRSALLAAGALMAEAHKRAG
jgi:hypothetical protein